MRGYIVCVYESIKDDEALKNYAIKARSAVEKYDGKFLVRGGKNIKKRAYMWVQRITWVTVCMNTA